MYWLLNYEPAPGKVTFLLANIKLKLFSQNERYFQEDPCLNKNPFAYWEVKQNKRS